jgi:hypothetical protein
MTREDMPPKTKKKLKKGETVAFKRGRVITLHWRNKKDVLLSTIRNAAMVDVEVCQNKMKPQAVIAYRDTMRGVGLVNWNLPNFPVPRK